MSLGKMVYCVTYPPCLPYDFSTKTHAHTRQGQIVISGQIDNSGDIGSGSGDKGEAISRHLWWVHHVDHIISQPTHAHKRQGQIVISGEIDNSGEVISRHLWWVLHWVFIWFWFWVGFGMGFRGGLVWFWVVSGLILCLENHLLKWVVLVVVGWCWVAMAVVVGWWRLMLALFSSSSSQWRLSLLFFFTVKWREYRERVWEKKIINK